MTGPTLGTRDVVYRISAAGEPEVFYDGFGRPQGLGFDRNGRLYVVDALSGLGGLFCFDANTEQPEQLIAAGGLVGVTFAPDGGVAVASGETVFRFFNPAS